MSLRGHTSLETGITFASPEAQSMKNIRSCSPQPSKVTDLPNEILTAIFSAAVNSTLASEHSRVLCYISLVCRDWRAVAVDSSELWTTVYISHLNDLPSAQLFFERSAPRLLDVILRFDFYVNWAISGKIAEVTFPHLHRFRTLNIEFDNPDTYHAFSSLFRTAAPSPPCLSSLRLHYTGATWSFAMIPNVHLLPSPNNIVSLDVHRLPVTVVSHYASLTTLSLYRVFLDHARMRDLFLASPSLETLILAALHTFNGPATSSDLPPIDASSLRCLALSMDSSHRDPCIPGRCVISCLCLPNLESLEVYGLCRHAVVGLGAHFGDLPKLRKLRLQHLVCSVHDEPFVRSLQLLRRLELVDADPRSWSGKCLPLPSLTSLVYSSDGVGNHYEWLADICRQRPRSGPPLHVQVTDLRNDEGVRDERGWDKYAVIEVCLPLSVKGMFDWEILECDREYKDTESDWFDSSSDSDSLI
ncbi:uncharacterized protein EV420DRAFT_1509181 [Desarmillaria tabescens]|uniref:F-box domain-containing protein n=1 Tax=Armillaria tabescens TaxID=1929756 RepID=A0AA39NI71_ARMTA|nr:uncharacterized protein EV420DRAFT_1509181 [Desarmillaria tabescens]KAK0465994.1 hypothetical protein EV420DRAFT_1509181 [Desarmillaria tabescens]